ncbi:CPBP family intramembrane metalloprotease [Microcoleus sp. FACHB-1515]|uniref:CPBP family intramembrane glutamic endopeptidase n=1 Tax=Cyanophyceae TaxID=3028117 RepID=UPI001688ABDF|nr:CPBP family intramembrane glutamic endopeptidase [Microcoleus sp. FACHB-1515]MBD2090875.1 CPBP family intramembrane metalloprotease [Microcoleus sp. FACHB-1515]
MNSGQINPAENPFVHLKVRRLVLWLLLISLLLGIAQGILSSALQIEPTDAIWTWIIYIGLMVSLCLLVLQQFDRLQVQLEDVVGQWRRANWLRLTGLVVAVLLSSLGWFLVSFYLLSLAAPSLVDALLEQINSSSTTETAFPLLDTILGPIVLVGFAPITEEFLFRGIILQRWATKWGIRPALIASSIVFGILHANFVGLSIFGLVMGLLYLKTRSLAVPIVCHALNNALAAVSLFAPETEDSASVTDLAWLQQNWWVGLVLIAMSAPFLLRFIFKNYPRRDAELPYFLNRSQRLDGEA